MCRYFRGIINPLVSASWSVFKPANCLLRSCVLDFDFNPEHEKREIASNGINKQLDVSDLINFIISNLSKSIINVAESHSKHCLWVDSKLNSWIGAHKNESSKRFDSKSNSVLIFMQFNKVIDFMFSRVRSIWLIKSIFGFILFKTSISLFDRNGLYQSQRPLKKSILKNHGFNPGFDLGYIQWTIKEKLKLLRFSNKWGN